MLPYFYFLGYGDAVVVVVSMMGSTFVGVWWLYVLKFVLQRRMLWFAPVAAAGRHVVGLARKRGWYKNMKWIRVRMTQGK